MKAIDRPGSPARLVRLADGANFLGISVTSVYQLIRRGVLHPIEVPGLRGPRLDVVDLEALVEASKHRPGEPRGQRVHADSQHPSKATSRS